MRRFFAFATAILLVLSPLAMAEALPSGAELLRPVTIPDVSGTSGNRALPAETQAPDEVSEPHSTEEPQIAQEPQPTAELQFPLPDLDVATPADPPASVAQPLLDGILEILEARDYTLTYEDVRAGTTDTLVLHRLDDEQLEITFIPAYGDLMRIVAGAEGCTVYAGDATDYSYEELLQNLFLEAGMDFSTGGALLSDTFASLEPSEEIDAFLQQALIVALEELSAAGLDFQPAESVEGSYLSLSFSPKLLTNAAVRFVDRMLEYEDEMDALLENYDAPLRALFPDLYEIYNPATGQYVQRVAYSCAELKEVWRTARQRLLTQWTDDAGANLQFYLSDDGVNHLNLSIRNFLADGASATLLLDIDEDDSCSGTLTIVQSNFDYSDGRYTNGVLIFDIQMDFTDDAALLRVVPRTPMEGFTAMTANLVFSFDGPILDVTTDLLQLHFDVDYKGIHGSLEVADDLSADLNLTAEEDYVHGSLIFSEGRYSYVLRLNE